MKPAQVPLNYRDYLNLFEGRLKGLGHTDILLYPDRAIGPSAEQILMDLRSSPKHCEHPWPSPAVYTTLRLAKAFLKALPELRPELSRREILEHFISLWPDRSVPSLVAEWDRVDMLLSHSTDSSFWMQICQEAVQASHPDLSEWFSALTTTLQWCVACESRELVGSRWHFLKALSAKVAELTRADLVKVFERSPWLWNSGSLTLHVPELKAPLPAEENFFAALSRHPLLEIIRYRDQSAGVASALEEIPSQSKEKRPGIFVVTGAHRHLTYSLLESEIARWGLDLPLVPESPLRLDLAKHHDTPELLEWQEFFARVRPHRVPSSSEILAAADFVGALVVNIASPAVHPQWSASGVGCVSLDDAWALPRQNLCLVTSAADYHDIWDPLSKTQKTKSPLPHGVAQLLSAQGLAGVELAPLIPTSFFAARFEDFTRWPAATEKSFERSPPKDPSPSDDAELERLRHHSPSGLEELLRCPFKFYDQRVLKNEEAPELDALSLNALRRGQWLHKALEEFFCAPDFESDIEIRLADSLQRHLERYFGDISSAPYLASLQKRIPAFARDLHMHVQNFEKPLNKIFPASQSKLELSLQTDLMDLSLRGIVDRLDFINSTQAFLWDYKSGGNYNSKLATLMGPRHRKIQWFLYAQMAEAELGVEVVGGGYLQVLRPQDSGVFIFASQISDETVSAIKNGLPVQDYGIKFLSSTDQEAAQKEFMDAMAQVSEILGARNFVRKPLVESLCDRCSSRVVCGRPFFAAQEETR